MIVELLYLKLISMKTFFEAIIFGKINSVLFERKHLSVKQIQTNIGILLKY
jgi:hypothetical protein